MHNDPLNSQGDEEMRTINIIPSYYTLQISHRFMAGLTQPTDWDIRQKGLHKIHQFAYRKIGMLCNGLEY